MYQVTSTLSRPKQGGSIDTSSSFRSSYSAYISIILPNPIRLLLANRHATRVLEDCDASFWQTFGTLQLGDPSIIKSFDVRGT